MRRASLLCFALIAFGGAAAPAPLAAEPILTVGEFQWDDYGFGLGPVFTILNYSNTPSFATGPIPADFTGGAFTNVLLTVDGAETPLDDLAAGAFNQVFGNFGTIAAQLSFSFLSQEYVVLLSQDCGVEGLPCVAAPDDFGEQHATRLIDYDVPPSPVGVPEPSSLVLISVGLAGTVLFRRRLA